MQVEKQKSEASLLYEESLITGVATIAQSKGYFRKIMKLLIVTGSLFGFLYQTREYLEIYWEYSTVSTEKGMDKFKKPAITLCDENLIRRKYFCENNPNLCHQPNDFKYYYPEYCLDESDMYLNVPVDDVVKYKEEYYASGFTKEFGFQMDEILILCQWKYRNLAQKYSNEITKTKCSPSKFVRVTTQKFLPGACYTLNSKIGNNHYQDEYLYGDSRLAMILKWQVSDYNNVIRFASLTLAEPKRRTYVLSVHNPGEIVNPFYHGVRLQERKKYRIKVSQIDRVRQAAPYSTNCTDYIELWKKYDGNGPLQSEDCKKKCKIQRVFEKYGCVSRHIDYPHEYPLCPDKKRHDDILNEKIWHCAENCQEACLETTYITKADILGQHSAVRNTICHYVGHTI